MDTQKGCIFPIPILQTMMDFCDMRDQITFGCTCKLFLSYFYLKYPILTTTLKFPMRFMGNFVVLDSYENILYTSDKMNQLIYKIDLETDTLETLCRFDTANERNNCPSGLALNEERNVLYIADSRNNVIRKFDLISGKMDDVLYVILGDGTFDGIRRDAEFDFPLGVALDSVSNNLYVAGNHSIRRIILNERRVETLCGGTYGYRDGSFEEARFHRSYDLVLNPHTQELYLSDAYTHVIRVVSLTNR